jgi:rhodanese-related sulfurtransferase
MEAHTPFQRVGSEHAEKLVARPDILILDVRDAPSFAKDHIDGAVNVSAGNISDIVEATQKSRPLLIYCRQGDSSRFFAKFFCHYGFRQVYSLNGGYEAWRTQKAAVAPLDDELREWLLRHGFPGDAVNAARARGETPLMKASNAGDIAIVRRLIDAGARVDARDADGNNALWLACAGNSLEAVEILVGAGIDRNNRNNDGATALIYATSAGKDSVAARLLALGADPWPETRDGFSALDLASTLECLNLMRRATRIAHGPATSDHRRAAELETANRGEQ